MWCFAVGIGVDGDHLHTQISQGAADADGDFSTISDEDFFKHIRTR